MWRACNLELGLTLRGMYGVVYSCNFLIIVQHVSKGG
jgi:hypothetical protein